MRADANRVRAMLRDPADGGELTYDGDRFLAHASGRVYQHIKGQPVLVDFARSVLDPTSFAKREHVGLIDRPRHRGISLRLKRLLSPEKTSTGRNIAAFMRALELRHDPIVLVVGGGSAGQGSAVLYAHPTIQVVAFDIYPTEHTHFVADAHDLPLPAQSVDGVVIQAVLEHVLEPQRVVDEMWRVLKPDGLVYAETPFLQHVHEGPYDFTRFTESGHRYLFRRFAVRRSGVSGGAGTQMTWSIDYLAPGLFRSRRAGKLFKLLFFWLHWLDRLVPEPYNSDAASGFYLLARKSNNTIGPRDAAALYRGAQR